MSKYKYVKEVEKEISRINEVIDFKILHGLRYREETRMHKMLLNQLGSLRRSQPRFSFLSMLF